MKIASLPNSQRILFAGSNDILTPASFYISSADLTDVALLPYPSEYPSIDTLEVSPDEQKLLYGRAHNVTIIDLFSGEELAQIDDIGSPAWLPDSETIVFLQCADGNCHEVVQYNLTSGESCTLFQSDDGLNSVIVTAPAQ
jgi:hypothetical protein